eukprot:CAMPEP_0170166696 /NCGR_PEP_ID=MMETSP0040_2-20121228/312_1 /TAXON_ID=641309 /ORGANISM="Lotharella oceanica, Strain CCMP622" /LENGTH=80 /DNA_ID=CAMNT_0010404493 /DNA_START=44 /DNA_END=286 /DNA_ORIENTATION=+
MRNAFGCSMGYPAAKMRMVSSESKKGHPQKLQAKKLSLRKLDLTILDSPRLCTTRKCRRNSDPYKVLLTPQVEKGCASPC